MGSTCNRITSVFAAIGVICIAGGLFCRFYYSFDAKVEVSTLLNTEFHVLVNATYKAIWRSFDGYYSLKDFYPDVDQHQSSSWLLSINDGVPVFVKSDEKVLIGSGTSWSSKLRYIKNVFTGVGKTSILQRFAGKADPLNTTTTMSPEPIFYEILIDDTIVRLVMWDTAGQERHRSSMPIQYFRNADGCILVYDVTNLPSFNSIDDMRDEVLLWSSADEPQLFPFVLLGNKVELATEDPGVVKVSDRRVELWKLQKDNSKVPSFRVSAKANINIAPAIEQMAHLAYRYHREVNPETDVSENIKLEEDPDHNHHQNSSFRTTFNQFLLRC